MSQFFSQNLSHAASSHFLNKHVKLHALKDEDTGARAFYFAPATLKDTHGNERTRPWQNLIYVRRTKTTGVANQLRKFLERLVIAALNWTQYLTGIMISEGNLSLAKNPAYYSFATQTFQFSNAYYEMA
ncbi:MAG: hypothetical protein MHMPM18_004739 [Marteilia pararefringens]